MYELGLNLKYSKDIVACIADGKNGNDTVTWVFNLTVFMQYDQCRPTGAHRSISMLSACVMDSRAKSSGWGSHTSSWVVVMVVRLCTEWTVIFTRSLRYLVLEWLVATIYKRLKYHVACPKLDDAISCIDAQTRCMLAACSSILLAPFHVLQAKQWYRQSPFPPWNTVFLNAGTARRWADFSSSHTIDTPEHTPKCLVSHSADSSPISFL